MYLISEVTLQFTWSPWLSLGSAWVGLVGGAKLSGERVITWLCRDSCTGRGFSLCESTKWWQRCRAPASPWGPSPPLTKKDSAPVGTTGVLRNIKFYYRDLKCDLRNEKERGGRLGVHWKGWGLWAAHAQLSIQSWHNRMPKPFNSCVHTRKLCHPNQSWWPKAPNPDEKM